MARCCQFYLLIYSALKIWGSIPQFGDLHQAMEFEKAEKIRVVKLKIVALAQLL
jgi:hypothetical protein